MRVHLIKKQAIEEYVAGHAAGKRSFEYWVTAVKYADWETPEDIQQTFGTADLLGGGYDRVVFDIGGNNYRLICKCHFGIKKVACLFVGLVHIQHTMNSAIVANNILFLSINTFYREDYENHNYKICNAI